MTKSPSPGETLRRGQAKVPQCKILQWSTSFQEFFNNLHKFSLLDNLQLSNSMKRIWYYKKCFYDLLGCAFAVTLLEYNYYSKRKCVKMAGMWIIHNTKYYMYYWEKKSPGEKTCDCLDWNVASTVRILIDSTISKFTVSIHWKLSECLWLIWQILLI